LAFLRRRRLGCGASRLSIVAEFALFATSALRLASFDAAVVKGIELTPEHAG
jgi:hypothetical protein